MYKLWAFGKVKVKKVNSHTHTTHYNICTHVKSRRRTEWSSSPKTPNFPARTLENGGKTGVF